MKSSQQFGLIVAYLLPGFVGLFGIVPLAPAVHGWLQVECTTEAGLGAPLYGLLAATTVGMICSCIRWLTVDQLLHLSGVVPPEWDDAQLEERLASFSYLVESHYRYYQFVANLLVAVLFSYAANRWMKTSPLLGIGTDLGIVILIAVLLAAARDSLAKYYARTQRLLGRHENLHSKG